MSQPPGEWFNVRRFGAAGDGRTLDTAAVQKAIDAAAGAGGGVAWVPPGDFLIGSVELKGNVDLHLEAGATLWGSTERADYDSSPKLPALDPRHPQYGPEHLIFARNAENVAITGLGAIDGQGDSFFCAPQDGMTHATAAGPRAVRTGEKRLALRGWRPERLIAFINCRNVLIEGVTLSNSPGWMLWPIGCEQVRIHRVRIVTNRWGPNTDGIDPDCCRDVHISDCFISAGDDCIAVKSSVNLLGEDRPCENITVTNCTLTTTCCAVRIGYEGDGAIRNCTFSNLVFPNTRTGINLLVPRHEHCQIHHGPPIENISFSNIVMDTQIAFYLWIGDDAAAPGCIRNVSIADVQATTERACYIGGSRAIPVEGVRLSNLHLTVRGETDEAFARSVPYPYPVFDDWTKRGIPHGIYCRHVRGLELRDVRVRWGEVGGPWRSALRCESVDEVTLDGLVAGGAPGPAGGPAVHLTDARRVFIRGCRAEPGAGAFLRLDGGATSAVSAIGNELAEARRAFDLPADLPPGALFEAANHLPND